MSFEENDLETPENPRIIHMVGHHPNARTEDHEDLHGNAWSCQSDMQVIQKASESPYPKTSSAPHDRFEGVKPSLKGPGRGGTGPKSDLPSGLVGLFQKKNVGFPHPNTIIQLRALVQSHHLVVQNLGRMLKSSWNTSDRKTTPHPHHGIGPLSTLRAP